MPLVTVEPVAVSPIPLERLREVLGPEQQDDLTRTVDRGLPLLAGRVVWNINSTARGGGVAEMLGSLVGYARAAGVDARWLVIGSEPDFFHVTKRLHNRLHGSAGDGGPLADHEHAVYERTSRAASERLARLVKAGDVVVLHDPQTAGLAAPLVERGAHLVWRAHIGLDLPNDYAREAWAFLLPYVRSAHAYVFSREAYAWEGLDSARVSVIAPSIDPFSAKNQPLEPVTAMAILVQAELVSDGPAAAPTFRRHDGSPGRVDRAAQLVDGVPPPRDAALVTQVSRWDRLKDPLGVMEAFVRHVLPQSDAHLMLAGPDVTAVSDDPEGAAVLEGCAARWQSLAPEARERLHLALLPMEDAEENAVIVNALQRRSNVIVQKSLAEGFGLTVTEAMWKGTPVVAGRIGGIQDQVTDGESGLLVDPTDLGAFGAAVLRLLRDPAEAERISVTAREQVRQEFLGVRHLTQYVDLFEKLITGRAARG